MAYEIFAERQVWSNEIAIHIGTRSPEGGPIHVLRPGVFQEARDGELRGAPALRLELKDAQRLMDELWNCGLRPSEGSGSAGSLAATQKHLADMQGIAKGLLRVQGVEI